MSIEILTTHIGPGPEYAGGINDFWFRALNISSLFQSGFPFVVKKETEKTTMSINTIHKFINHAEI